MTMFRSNVCFAVQLLETPLLDATARREEDGSFVYVRAGEASAKHPFLDVMRDAIAARQASLMAEPEATRQSESARAAAGTPSSSTDLTPIAARAWEHGAVALFVCCVAGDLAGVRALAPKLAAAGLPPAGEGASAIDVRYDENSFPWELAVRAAELGPEVRSERHHDITTSRHHDITSSRHDGKTTERQSDRTTHNDIAISQQNDRATSHRGASASLVARRVKDGAARKDGIV